MDVKGAFDHVSKKKLAEKIINLGIDGDLVGQTQSFMADKRVEFIINGHINPEIVINIDIF